MHWTTLKFGTHAGKSLPQIVISDPDWFFWAVACGVFTGTLAAEAEDLVDKATAIKIPKLHFKRWRVEYRYEDRGSFLGLSSLEPTRTAAITRPGCRILICHVFGAARRMTRRAAEICCAIF